MQKVFLFLEGYTSMQKECYFLHVFFCSNSPPPQTSFLMIQMTKDQFNKPTLCKYYMLWNIDRKCSKKLFRNCSSHNMNKKPVEKGEGAPVMEF